MRDANHIPVDVALGKLSVRDPVDVDPGEGDFAPGRRSAHELALMSSARTPASDDFVALGQLLLDRVRQVGKRGVESRVELLCLFEIKRRIGAGKMEYVVGREELVKYP